MFTQKTQMVSYSENPVKVVWLMVSAAPLWISRDVRNSAKPPMYPPSEMVALLWSMQDLGPLLQHHVDNVHAVAAAIVH